jgi:hypothetical protein
MNRSISAYMFSNLQETFPCKIRTGVSKSIAGLVCEEPETSELAMQQHDAGFCFCFKQIKEKFPYEKENI